MMNLTIMKMNLALKVEAPPKPTTKSSENEKKNYEDLEYSNSCCLMIMENHNSTRQMNKIFLLLSAEYVIVMTYH